MSTTICWVSRVLLMNHQTWGWSWRFCQHNSYPGEGWVREWKGTQGYHVLYLHVGHRQVCTHRKAKSLSSTLEMNHCIHFTICMLLHKKLIYKNPNKPKWSATFQGNPHALMAYPNTAMSILLLKWGLQREKMKSSAFRGCTHGWMVLTALHWRPTLQHFMRIVLRDLFLVSEEEACMPLQALSSCVSFPFLII